MNDSLVLREIADRARPLRDPGDLTPVLDEIGDARFVLIGEASHGTRDYYGWRATLTRRLVSEKGFDFVAVEGDWPDCFRVNRWLKDQESDETVRDVLARFERWPTWMWANEEVATFLGWLREHNRRSSEGVGFYGLDVYSLWDSLDVILGYLGETRPDALEAARRAVSCFEPYGGDPQAYAAATRLVPEDCEDEVLELLVSARRGAPSFDGHSEAALDAVQNAEVLRGAEQYYRTMVLASGESWNVRDRHMAATLDRLVDHHGPESRAVVWEHNTHVGDARATDMSAAGMVNVGQLVREQHSDDGVVLVGFGGHRGSVVAADRWGGRQEVFPVPEAPAGTHEDLLHRAVGEPSLFVLDDEGPSDWLTRRRGHRAIGVVYRPEVDHLGNWVPTALGARYDVFLSLDETRALRPLGPEAPTDAELETFPWAV